MLLLASSATRTPADPLNVTATPQSTGLLNLLNCSFGYRLPPHTLVPLHGALLALKALLKPSQPFCAVLQTVDTQPLFQAIAIK